MARINSNISALIARANLNRANEDLSVRLERLATGVRLNRGADDPAGMIISERIRSDLRGVEQGIKNAERASSVISTTEASLNEVSDLLNSIKALVVESANTGAVSDEERDANQQQIDSAIDSITRISNTATFGGLRLLDGSLDYTLSGVSASAISKAQVLGASFAASPNLQVDVEVLGSAQTGALYMRGDYTGANQALNGTLLSSMTLRIAGPRGVTEIQLTSGQTLEGLAKAVNTLTGLTGVEASVLNPADLSSGLVFSSEAYGTGSKAFVTVNRIGGPDPSADSFTTYKLTNDEPVPNYPPFPWAGYITGGQLTTSGHDEGKNVQALVNGILANGDGLGIAVRSPSLSLQVLLTEAKAIQPTTGTYDSTTTFTITGGGALFQLGPEINANQQTNLGVQSVASSQLGGTLVDGGIQFLSSLKSGEFNSLSNSESRQDFSSASDILEAAVDEIAILRGRLGAFERNVLETNVRSLQSAFENLSASQSQIRDADFAAETSALTRSQILVSSGTSVLQLANQQSQAVLQLLG
jgi:flagellin